MATKNISDKVPQRSRRGRRAPLPARVLFGSLGVAVMVLGGTGPLHSGRGLAFFGAVLIIAAVHHRWYTRHRNEIEVEPRPEGAARAPRLLSPRSSPLLPRAGRDRRRSAAWLRTHRHWTAPACAGCSTPGARSSAELDLEEVLERLLETARELTGARYAALGVLDAERRELERFLTRGIDAEAHARDRRPAARPRHPRRADRAIRGRCGSATSATHPRSLRLPARPPADDDVPRRAGADPRRGLGQPLPDREGGRRAVRRGRRGRGRRCSPSGPRSRSRTRASTRPPSAPRRARARRCGGCEATTAIARALGGGDRPRPRARADRQARARARRARSVLVLLRRGRRARGRRGAGQVDGRGREPSRVRRSRGDVLRAARPAIADVARAAALAERTGRARRATALLVPLRLPRALARRAARVRPLGGGPAFGEATSSCCSRSPRAPRPPSPPRGRSRRSGCATASLGRGRARAAGRASCTTRRCRGSAACACCSPRRARARGRRRDARRARGRSAEQIDGEIASLRALITRAAAGGARRARARAGDRGLAARTRRPPRARGRRPSSASTRRRSARGRDRALPDRPGGADQRRQARRRHARRGRGARATDGDVQLSVADDGRGFDPAAPARASGWRACASGWRWPAGHRLDDRDLGTRVSATFPVSAS